MNMKQTLFSFSSVFTALLLAGVWLVSVPSSVQAAAATRYLSPTGTDSGDCTNPGAPCRTINYARSQSSAGDTLNLAPGIYNENVNLFIDMTIIGAGSVPAETIVDGGGLERVFAVYGGSITLRNLTIQHGDGTAQTSGGGIFNNATLMLDRVILKDNYAPGSGGGIYNAGTLTVTHSIIQNNTTASVGGGLINFGAVTIDHSTFSGNVSASIAAYAGGLHNNSGRTMTIVNSTISGNTAADGAGLTNSGTLTLTNVTIANNTATNSGGMSGVSNYGTVTFKNTIVADNTGGAQCGGGGVFTSLGYNLESANSCNFNQGTDLPSTSAGLHPLAMYGGSTSIHLLAPGSAAIDTGTNSGCPADDQRDTPRPIDGDGSAGAVCDIGAVEFDPATDFYKIYLPLILR